MSIDHLAVLESASRSFTEAVSRPGALARPVPSCPEWTVGDLVDHLAEVQTWWRYVVSSGVADFDEDEAVEAGKTGPDRLAGWRAINEAYLAVQRDTSPRSAVWCWWNEERRATAGDVASRQAHEAVVHCWDAQNAVGEPEPIEAAVAADGVEEFLTRFLNGPEWSASPLVLGLHAADVDRTWTVATSDGKPRSVPEEAADVVISGSAEQLYLLLWRRVSIEGLTVKGDETRALAFLGWPNLS
jgi:uncharacterized protein (TIGR03083 family)